MTWAVFMDRCNTVWREADGLSQVEAEALAAQLSTDKGWFHYAAPSDTNFDPLAGLTEAEYYAMQNEEESWEKEIPK
jgi:hypothetical protein